MKTLRRVRHWIACRYFDAGWADVTIEDDNICGCWPIRITRCAACRRVLAVHERLPRHHPAAGRSYPSLRAFEREYEL